jgi:hypothetical protein
MSRQYTTMFSSLGRTDILLSLGASQNNQLLAEFKNVLRGRTVVLL